MRHGSAEGYTPLHYGGELGQADLARDLLAMGVDGDARPTAGTPPT